MPGLGPTSFFDTNVLLYLASSDEAKARRVEELLQDGGTVSVQVLNEIANVLRRKMRAPWERAMPFIQQFPMILTVVPVTLQIHETGLRLAERYELSVYDGMIVSAALVANCSTLFSEDMHDGLVVDGSLTIRNPFV